ncbi:MAG: sulfur carrier protein ThiS [Polyangiaceae bacterium]|jgi:sulfur carrier protein|nr:sulfur carrier protein ThiS [Polyangiaceae bacterium]
MVVWVNGDATDLPEGLTVRALIERLGLGGGPVAVERNRAVVPRAQHGTTSLGEGDRVEIVHFVGGG